MRKRSIEELIVAVERGEPLPVADRERLDAALARDAAADALLDAQRSLGVELAALRRSLAALPLPADERALAAAFRHLHARRRAASQRRRRYAVGAAAGVGVVVATLVALWPPALERPPAPTPTAAAVPSVAGSGSAAVFHALPYPSATVAGGAYSVVRVRIPLSSLTAGFAPGGSEAVEADVLIGEDGLVSAIRFDRPGTVYVSTDSR